MARRLYTTRTMSTAKKRKPRKTPETAVVLAGTAAGSSAVLDLDNRSSVAKQLFIAAAKVRVSK